MILLEYAPAIEDAEEDNRIFYAEAERGEYCRAHYIAKHGLAHDDCCVLLLSEVEKEAQIVG